MISQIYSNENIFHYHFIVVTTLKSILVVLLVVLNMSSDWQGPNTTDVWRTFLKWLMMKEKEVRNGVFKAYRDLEMEFYIL